jgi:hypothetical protein
VLAAMHRQIDRLAYAHTSFFTSDAVEQLAEHLTRTAPGELNYAYFAHRQRAQRIAVIALFTGDKAGARWLADLHKVLPRQSRAVLRR